MFLLYFTIAIATGIPKHHLLHSLLILYANINMVYRVII